MSLLQKSDLITNLLKTPKPWSELFSFRNYIWAAGEWKHFSPVSVWSVSTLVFTCSENSTFKETTQLTLFLFMFLIFFFLYLHLSSPFKEEPSDVREEESHLRLRHGIHHQRHVDRSQSDAEEWHGVAPPTVHVEQASLHVHATGWGRIPVTRKRNNAQHQL